MSKVIGASWRATTETLVKKYTASHKRRQALKQLGATLNDQLLDDIGLSRDAVVSELGYNPRPSQKLMRISAL